MKGAISTNNDGKRTKAWTRKWMADGACVTSDDCSQGMTSSLTRHGSFSRAPAERMMGNLTQPTNKTTKGDFKDEG
jgi:hypothetical protein